LNRIVEARRLPAGGGALAFKELLEQLARLAGAQTLLDLHLMVEPVVT
jgi:hypothetical protein